MSDLRREPKCCRCNVEAKAVGAWFTANATWNEVIGGDPDREVTGMICPTCFVEAAGGVWALVRQEDFDVPAWWGGRPGTGITQPPTALAAERDRADRMAAFLRSNSFVDPPVAMADVLAQHDAARAGAAIPDDLSGLDEPPVDGEGGGEP